LRAALISRRKINMHSEDKVDEICEFLKLLLNDEVLSLTLRGLPTYHKEEMKCITDTLFSVAKECPDLQKLVCEEDYHYILCNNDLEFCDSVRMLSCTLRFVKLQVFDMNSMVCNDVSIALLAENLPQLRYTITFHLNIFLAL
jgi:hypothetical protein